MEFRKKTASAITLTVLLLSVVVPLFSLSVEPVKAARTTDVDLPLNGSWRRGGYFWSNYNATSQSWYVPFPADAGPWQPTMPLIFDLSGNGFKPGDWLGVSWNGTIYENGLVWEYAGFSAKEKVPGTNVSDMWILGVFSSDGVVDQDISKLKRVPGAIDVSAVSLGIDYPSGQVINCISGFPKADWTSTNYEMLTTDIPEDFFMRNGKPFEIQIPPGAKYFMAGFANTQAQYSGSATVSFERDSDGDGLPDSWEQDGLDVDGDGEIDLDLPMMGADYLHKDLFVEVDYMGSAMNCSGHYPNFVAMQDVKAAFRNSPATNPDGTTGVNSHILVDEELPHQDVLTGDAGWTGFNSLKRDHFGTSEDRNSTNKNNILEAKRRVYHYCLFVHSRQNRDGGGVGELPGNDFMVSMAEWQTSENTAPCFMHELGHNLGLHHGGADNVNYKPNYLSIMNYLFLYDGDPVPGRPLDYSRRQLLDLNENALDEEFGIGDLPPSQTAFSLPPVNFYNAKIGLADGSLGIDWNGNGTIDGNGTVSANVNNFPQWNSTSGGGENLRGFNDWANLNFNFRAVSSYAESSHPTDNVEEPTKAMVQAMHEAGQSAVIPEFQPSIILPVLLALSLFGAVLLRKRKQT